MDADERSGDPATRATNAVNHALAEAAKQLGVSKATAWRWTKSGALGSFRLGGVVRVPQSEIDACLAAHTYSAVTAQIPARPRRTP